MRHYIRVWNLSHIPAAKPHASLRIHVVSPEHFIFHSRVQIAGCNWMLVSKFGDLSPPERYACTLT